MSNRSHRKARRIDISSAPTYAWVAMDLNAGRRAISSS